MNEVCPFCFALLFEQEKKRANCCSSFPTINNRKLLPPPLPPNPFSKFLRDEHTRNLFRANSRRLNAVVAMSSAVTEVDYNVAPYTHKIHGSYVHLVSKRLDANDENHNSFLNWYLFDSDEASLNGTMQKFFADDRRELQLCFEMMREIEAFVRAHNPLAKLIRTISDLPLQGPRPQLLLLGDEDTTQRSGAAVARRYNMPVVEEIAAILPGGAADHARFRALQIWWQNGAFGDRTVRRLERVVSGEAEAQRLVPVQLGRRQDANEPKTQRIHETHMLWDPLRYPLMFPYASRGWGTDWQRNWSLQQYARFFLHTRNPRLRPDVALDANSFGRLFNEFVVDQAVKVESDRLSYLRHHQEQLRSELWRELDQRMQEGITDPQEIGQRVILPKTFVGSPRDMMQKYHDAMAAARNIGNPQLFLTFTANPNWKEVRDNLRPGETARDRPDLVVRVFHAKAKQLLESLGTKDPNKHRFHHLLGRLRFIVWVIEFQKRGLPHMHVLATYERPITPDTADAICCAEIPDARVRPRLFSKVTDMMMHACSVDRCLDPQTGQCSRNFPKPFVDKTHIDDKGQMRIRRRNVPSNTVQMRVGKPDKTNVIENIGNNYVVTYNPELLLEFDAHINVEIVGIDPNAPPTPQLFKYLMNYLFKGGDRIVAGVEVDNGMHDEIKRFVDSRYLSTHEALWRLLEYKMRQQKPACESLPVHLPQENLVQFEPNQLHDPEFLEKRQRTKLTAFFDLVQSSNGKLSDLMYENVPNDFSWNDRSKRWTTRQNNQKFPTIGRLAWVHPRMTEAFYLRLLLMHVPGPNSFVALRTVDGVVCDSFLEAARRRGLAGKTLLIMEKVKKYGN